MPKGDSMRPLFKVIIAVFIVLILIAVTSQVRGEEKKPAPPHLVIPDEPPKLYYPKQSRDTWTKMVNHLMTKKVWKDMNGNSIYTDHFLLGEEACILAYNHDNGALSMTIVQVRPEHINIKGRDSKLTLTSTKLVYGITLISIDYDTIPDLIVTQSLDLDSKAEKLLVGTVVVDTVPRGKLHPIKDKRLWRKKLGFVGTWAMWEVHIMDGLGFQMIIPPKKEKL